MRRIIAVFMIAALVAATGSAVPAQEKKGISTSDITKVVDSYKGKEGFEVMSIGSLGMSFVKTLATISGDPEATKIMKGLEKMVIVEYADADGKTKDEFLAMISHVLGNAETLMSVNGGGQTMNMYGTISEKGDTIDDLIIFVPADCALICFFGEISAEVMGM